MVVRPPGTEIDASCRNMFYLLFRHVDTCTSQTQRKLDGSTDVQLILTRALDRESRDLYKVKVVAWDGGSPPRSGTVEVKVVVTDANDNGPVFEYSSYEVTVAENIDVGTKVAKVTAFDADAGLNAEVSIVSSGFMPVTNQSRTMADTCK